MDAKPQGAEQPPLLGAPYVVQHPMWRRVGYVVVGLFIVISATVQASLFNGNITSVAGEAGLTVAEAEWLVIAFISAAAFSNLAVIKGRQQFGIQTMLYTLLTFDIITGLFCIVEPAYPFLMLNRVANGLMTSTCVAGGVYYFIQSFPKKHRIVAVALAIAAVQMGGPIAAMVPVETLTRNANFGAIHLTTALAAISLMLVLLLPMPPSYTGKVFEPFDIVSALLCCGTLVPLVAAIVLGRTLWWTDTSWLGWLLVASVVLGAVVIGIEISRSNPLLYIDWLSSKVLVQFILVAVVERVLLAEQSTGAVGLFSLAGLNNDELHAFYGFVLAGMILGTVVACLTLSAKTIPPLCLSALVAIIIAAWLDTGSNALTRPPEMYLSQTLLGFGTTLFVAPALVYGVGLVLHSDARHFISTILVFAAAQSIGSAIGSALLGSLQYIFEYEGATVLAGRLGLTASLATTIASRGASSVASNFSNQASIIGYINMFGFVWVLAICVAGFIGIRIAWREFGEMRQRRAAR